MAALYPDCTFIYGPDTLFSINGLHSLLNSAMVLLFSIALTLLVSTFALKQQSLSMIANVASLGLSFLSGIFVPQYLLGKGVLAVAHFLPTYWYIRLNSMLGGISDEILTTAKYWRFIGIQFGFFVAIFCIYLVSSIPETQPQRIIEPPEKPICNGSSGGSLYS